MVLASSGFSRLSRIQWIHSAISAYSETFSDFPEQMHVRSRISRGRRLLSMTATSMATSLVLGLAVATPQIARRRFPGYADQTGRPNPYRSAIIRRASSPSLSPARMAGPPRARSRWKMRAKPLAGVVLNADGTAEVTLDLVQGRHELSAIYQGDATHAGSASVKAEVSAEVTGTPDFQVAVSPASVTLTQGQSGETTVSITPVNSSALSRADVRHALLAPAIRINLRAALHRKLLRFSPAQRRSLPAICSLPRRRNLSVEQWCIARNQQTAAEAGLPWHFCCLERSVLAGLAFTARKSGLGRLALIALVALATSFGMTACSPLYGYYNHGPNPNLPHAGWNLPTYYRRAVQRWRDSDHAHDQLCADGEHSYRGSISPAQSSPRGKRPE